MLFYRTIGCEKNPSTEDLTLLDDATLASSCSAFEALPQTSKVTPLNLKHYFGFFSLAKIN